MRRAILLSFFLVALYPKDSAAQDVKALNSHISKSLTKIWALFDSSRSGWRTSGSKGLNYYDSLETESKRLKRYLLKTLSRVPASLTMQIPPYPDTQFDNGMWVVTSPDGNVREWSWNTFTGGSMPTIYQVIEYSTPEGIKTFDPDPRDEGDLQNSSYRSISCVQSNTGITYYLPLEGWVGDGRTCGQTLKAFIIDGTRLKFGIKLFSTGKKNVSEIPIYFPDGTNEWNYVEEHSISVKDNGRMILVPLITSEDSMTSQHLRYDFDGEHYIYKGIE